MARRKIIEEEGIGMFGIKCTDANGRVGWIVGEGGKVLLFSTQKAAEKAFKVMKADDRYSWSNPAEVAQFEGFGHKYD